MKPAFLDRLLNALALLVLAGISLFLAARWQALPSRVPMHYNAFGEIDRWGSKTSLAALLGVAWVLYGLLSVIGRFPALWNTGACRSPRQTRPGSMPPCSICSAAPSC